MKKKLHPNQNMFPKIKNKCYVILATLICVPLSMLRFIYLFCSSPHLFYFLWCIRLYPRLKWIGIANVSILLHMSTVNTCIMKHVFPFYFMSDLRISRPVPCRPESYKTRLNHCRFTRLKKKKIHIEKKKQKNSRQ